MARPSDGTQPKGGKKNRKHGRNRKWCEAYRARGQREINKARKARKQAKKLQAGTSCPLTFHEETETRDVKFIQDVCF